MENIILRVLKLNVKVNPLHIASLIRIWMGEPKGKTKSWNEINTIFQNLL